MSATITSDRTNLRKRGTMLAYIFSNQGWGSFGGSLMTIIVLAIYKHVMEDEGKTSKVDGGRYDVEFFDHSSSFIMLVWRIVVGVSLIPAFGTLYQRLTLPESTRYTASKKLTSSVSSNEESDLINQFKQAQLGEKASGNKAEVQDDATELESPDATIKEEVKTDKAHISGNS